MLDAAGSLLISCMMGGVSYFLFQTNVEALLGKYVLTLITFHYYDYLGHELLNNFISFLNTFYDKEYNYFVRCCMFFLSIHI